MLCWLLQMPAGLGIQLGLSPKGGAYTCAQKLEIRQSTEGTRTSRKSPRFLVKRPRDQFQPPLVPPRLATHIKDLGEPKKSQCWL